MTRNALVLLTLSAFAAASGQLFFKLGAQGRERLIDFFNPYLLVGVLLYAASAAIWIYVLSYERLVNVYAFTALTFVIVYLGGVFVLGERLSATAAAGLALVLLGLFLIGTNSQ
jgi:drug/metabolite transporter (DMT)-like permease